MKNKKRIESKKIKSLKIRQKRVKRLKERSTNPNIVRNNPSSYYLIANKPHRVTEEEIKAMKLDLLTLRGLTKGVLLKFIKIQFCIVPNKVLTNKGILKRMGGGKSSPKTYVLYLVPGKILITLTPHFATLPSTSQILLKTLKLFIRKYPFLSIVSLP